MTRVSPLKPDCTHELAIAGVNLQPMVQHVRHDELAIMRRQATREIEFGCATAGNPLSPYLESEHERLVRVHRAARCHCVKCGNAMIAEVGDKKRAIE